MARNLSLLAILLLPVAAAPGPASEPTRHTVDAEVRRILEAHAAARPAESDLGLFRLDWAGSLAEAKARAAREKRPIFFVSTTQLKDAGDLRGGHC